MAALFIIFDTVNRASTQRIGGYIERIAASSFLCRLEQTCIDLEKTDRRIGGGDCTFEYITHSNDACFLSDCDIMPVI